MTTLEVVLVTVAIALAPVSWGYTYVVSRRMRELQRRPNADRWARVWAGSSPARRLDETSNRCRAVYAETYAQCLRPIRHEALSLPERRDHHAVDPRTGREYHWSDDEPVSRGDALP